MGTSEAERGEQRGHTKISVITNDLEESLKAEINGWCPEEARKGQEGRERG